MFTFFFGKNEMRYVTQLKSNAHRDKLMPLM